MRQGGRGGAGRVSRRMELFTGVRNLPERRSPVYDVGLRRASFAGRFSVRALCSKTSRLSAAAYVPRFRELSRNRT